MMFVANTIKLFATFVFVNILMLKAILNVKKLYIDEKIVIFSINNKFVKKLTKFF